MKKLSKALILTVGYGHGHRSAAGAIAEAFLQNGVKVRIEDPCEVDTSGFYSITKAYYRLCVRRLPWLWAMAYSQTETADWHTKVKWPLIRRATSHLGDLIISWRPDIVVCTYPLYAYMIDYLRSRGMSKVPCAVVVTDALEISKPWVKSDFDYLFVPDEYSRNLLLNRYGLDSLRVFSCGFPVQQRFLQAADKGVPSSSELKILYGVHISPRKAMRWIIRILNSFPKAQIVVLAGAHYELMRRKMHLLPGGSAVTLLSSTDRMSQLLSDAHIYIGKTGAATMFECYAGGVPMLVNYALPGQEQGNLELLLSDECGRWVGDDCDICTVLDELLASNAKQWLRLRNNMLSKKARVNGAISIVKQLFVQFGYEQ